MVGRGGGDQSGKFGFFEKFAKPRGSHRETRIITELGVPVQDAFDALLIMSLGRFPPWAVLRLEPCPYFLHYGV
jgi:hypothetical protein